MLPKHLNGENCYNVIRRAKLAVNLQMTESL